MTGMRRLLSSPGFLTGLALLLANDWLFKPVFHNALTGKLSDFAGLFIFPLFWTALFPRRKTLIFSATAVFFVFWKMPLSQSWLDVWKNTGLWPLARVADAGDLWALCVLPMSWLYSRRAKPTVLPAPLPLAVAVFAFAATSFYTVETYNKQYVLDFSKNTLRERLLRDSVWADFATQFTAQNPDTLRIGPSQFPNPGTPAFVATVTELDPNRTLVTLLTASNRAPGNKKNRQHMLESFENQFYCRIKAP